MGLRRRGRCSGALGSSLALLDDFLHLDGRAHPCICSVNRLLQLFDLLLAEMVLIGGREERHDDGGGKEGSEVDEVDEVARSS